MKLEPLTIDGMKAYSHTPAVIASENRNRLLIHVHGGCYARNAGESGTADAALMTGSGTSSNLGRLHPYPAALDDAMTVWKAALKMAQSHMFWGGAPRWPDCWRGCLPG